MHVLFILESLHLLDISKDSSIAIMRSLSVRGHTISVARQSDLYIERTRVGIKAVPIKLTTGDKFQNERWWEELGKPRDVELIHFDVTLVRKDPPFNIEYFYATHLLEYAKKNGAFIFNEGAAIRNHPEKLAILEFADLAPPTLVSSDIEKIKTFYQCHKDVVLKPLDLMGGQGVFRIGANELNLNVILETLTQEGTKTIMAQRYLPEIVEGDKRILLINGEPVPYVLVRIPKLGDIRGNLKVGAQAHVQPLSGHDLKLAKRVGSHLSKRGLLLVGLDVIGKNITEINVTSPTGFVEITSQSGFDVAGLFTTTLEHLAAVKS